MGADHNPDAIDIARQLNRKFRKDIGLRTLAGIATLGGSEIASGTFALADDMLRQEHKKPGRAGYHKGPRGQHPHPHRRGEPRALPAPRGRHPGALRAHDRAEVARHLAGQHGSVLIDRARSRWIHPRPGRVAHDRATVARLRAGLPATKGDE